MAVTLMASEGRSVFVCANWQGLKCVCQEDAGV